MATLSLPLVTTCSAEGCSYNHDHDCHAAAITVAEVSQGCSTYVEAAEKAGVAATAQVGACHRADCMHNAGLECAAESVEIGGTDVADCLTYASV